MDTGRAPLSQLPQRIPAHSSAWAAAGPRACAPRPRGATRLPRRLPPARPPAQAANSSEAWRGATGRQATAGRAARAEGGAGRVGRRPAREESAPRLEAPPARRRRPVPGRACCQGQSPAARQARPVAAGRTRARAARRPGRGGGSERPGEARRAKGRAGRAPTAAAPAVPGSTTRRPPAGELTPCVAASVGGCRALVGPGVVVSAGRRPAGGGLGEPRRGAAGRGGGVGAASDPGRRGSSRRLVLLAAVPAPHSDHHPAHPGLRPRAALGSSGRVERRLRSRRGGRGRNEPRGPPPPRHAWPSRPRRGGGGLLEAAAPEIEMRVELPELMGCSLRGGVPWIRRKVRNTLRNTWPRQRLLATLDCRFSRTVLGPSRGGRNGSRQAGATCLRCGRPTSARGTSEAHCRP